MKTDAQAETNANIRPDLSSRTKRRTAS